MARPRAKLDRCGEADLVTRRLNTEPPGARRERLLAVQLGLRGELGLDRIAQAVGTPLTDRLPSLPGSGEPNYAWRDTPRIIQGKSRPARSPPLLSRTFPFAAADEGKRIARRWNWTGMPGALGLSGEIPGWRPSFANLQIDSIVPQRNSANPGHRLCAGLALRTETEPRQKPDAYDESAVNQASPYTADSSGGKGWWRAWMESFFHCIFARSGQSMAPCIFSCYQRI